MATLRDHIEALIGDDLHDHGLENPCTFRSRGLYPATNGCPPCEIVIVDPTEMERRCIEHELDPIDYIEMHLTREGEPFRIECRCLMCFTSQEGPRVPEPDAITAYVNASKADREFRFRELLRRYHLHRVPGGHMIALRILVDAAVKTRSGNGN